MLSNRLELTVGGPGWPGPPGSPNATSDPGCGSTVQARSWAISGGQVGT